MEKLNVLLEKMIQYLESAEGFVNAHASEVVKQFLEYEVFISKQGLTIGIIILVVGIVFIFIGIWLAEKAEGPSIAVCVLSFLLIVSSFFTIPINYFNLKRVQLAPKVVVLEFLKDNLK